MTQEEKDILLVDCKKKIEEIEHQKQLEEQAWTDCYNTNYRRRFAIEDTLGNIASSTITGLVVFGSAIALSATGHSAAISIGLPVGGYAVIGMSAITASLANSKKYQEYLQELGEHTSIQDELDEECNVYQLVSKYITMGDKYLLQLYRQNLKSKSAVTNKDEFAYLDIDTTNLSPLMSKAIEEIKARSVQLREALKNDILKDIHFMQTQIAESATVTIPELEEVQKMLKQHVPVTMTAQALTK